MVDIEINQSLKNSFLSIKTMFMNTNYNTIYTNLYFKKRIKEIILKNIDITKYYKAYIIKKYMLSFNFRDEQQFYSEKYNSIDIINDIDNIQNLEKKKEYLKPQLIKSSTTDYNYNLTKMYEDLDQINYKISGNSITYIHNTGCDIKLTQCDLLRGSRFNYELIPKKFLDSKIINVIQNKDNICFLYCMIRVFYNKPPKHKERVSLIDKKLVKK